MQKASDAYKNCGMHAKSSIHKSIAYEKIYSSYNIDYLLSLEKGYLKEVSYRRDNINNCTIRDELLYEKVEENEINRLNKIKELEKCNSGHLPNSGQIFKIYELLALDECMKPVEPYYKVTLEKKKIHYLIGFYKKRK